MSAKAGWTDGNDDLELLLDFLFGLRHKRRTFKDQGVLLIRQWHAKQIAQTKEN